MPNIFYDLIDCIFKKHILSLQTWRIMPNDISKRIGIKATILETVLRSHSIKTMCHWSTIPMII